MRMSPMKLMVFVVLFLLPLLLFGCTGPKRSIDASAIDPLIFSVTERHDRYVTADTSLSESERAQYLRSSTLLRQIQDTAMQRPTVVPATPPSTVPTAATGRTK